MAVRAPRLLSALAAAGLVTGSLLAGAGAAAANTVPQPPGGGTVAATCGETVAAYPGDRVLVTPQLGPSFMQSVVPGMSTVSQTVAGLLCQVNVNVLVPVQAQVEQIAPPLAELTAPVTEGAGQALAPQSPAAQAPAEGQATQPFAAAAPGATAPESAAVTELPASGPAAALSPGEMAANAPLFAPTFSSQLPSSFLSSASPATGYTGYPGYGAPAPSLFGSAFPGLSAGAPGMAGMAGMTGTDPTSAVTTASQVQALPVENLSGGVGIPAILAVLVASGVAALAVRRMVLGRTLLPAGLGAAPVAHDAVDAGEQAPAESAAERTSLVAPIEDTPTTVGTTHDAEATGVVAPVAR